MAIRPTAVPVAPKYQFVEYPKFLYSEKHPTGVVVQNPGEEDALDDAEGPLFDSPADLPKPKAVVQVDLAAENATLKAEVEHLRKVNGDLVARLALAQTPVPYPPQPPQSGKAKASKEKDEE